jgi:hypothetical protein
MPPVISSQGHDGFPRVAALVNKESPVSPEKAGDEG